MADAKSNALENLILDHIFNTSAFAVPAAAPKVALSTADPTEDGSGLSEPSDGYARVQTAAADWSAASVGSLHNDNAISFGTATGAWGTLTHFALYGSASGEPGTMYYYGTLTTAKTVGSGDVAQFPASSFVVKEQ